MNAIARMKIIEIRTEIEQLRETVAAQAADIRILEIEFGDVRDSFLYYKEMTRAQAAVIEKLRGAFNLHHEIGLGLGRDKSNSLTQLIISGYKHSLLCRITQEALAIPTDSTQILDEVRKQERERCAELCEKSDRYRGDYFAAKIRAME